VEVLLFWRAPASATPEPRAGITIGLAIVAPLRSSVLPVPKLVPLTVTVPVPRAQFEPTRRMPFEPPTPATLVPPEWLLDPESVSVPVPVFVITPVPAKTRSTVRAEALVIVIVLDERISIVPLPLFIDAGSVSLPPSWSVLPAARFTP